MCQVSSNTVLNSINRTITVSYLNSHKNNIIFFEKLIKNFVHTRISAKCHDTVRVICTNENSQGGYTLKISVTSTADTTKVKVLAFLPRSQSSALGQINSHAKKMTETAICRGNTAF